MIFVKNLTMFEVSSTEAVPYRLRPASSFLHPESLTVLRVRRGIAQKAANQLCPHPAESYNEPTAGLVALTAEGGFRARI